MNSDPTYVRPMPPEHMRSPGLSFVRARELEDFVRNEFLGRGGIFFDAEHGHLGNQRNRVGFLWAASRHVDRSSEKAGTAQLLKRGEPSTGEPVWCTRPHDVEQFTGTVERWGAPAAGAEGFVLAGVHKARFHWVPGRDLDVRKACGSA